MSRYTEFHQQSIEHPEVFWAEQSKLIDWETPFEKVLDYSNPPFARWFVGGKTNICYNAIDRHLKDRSNQAALIAVSTETNTEVTYTYQELFEEVNRMAAILQAQGVEKGIEFSYTCLWWQRLALQCWHLYVLVQFTLWFVCFASHSLAARIEDAKPNNDCFCRSGDTGRKSGSI
jgi:propionyl-CoA synthetase